MTINARLVQCATQSATRPEATAFMPDDTSHFDVARNSNIIAEPENCLMHKNNPTWHETLARYLQIGCELFGFEYHHEKSERTENRDGIIIHVAKDQAVAAHCKMHQFKLEHEGLGDCVFARVNEDGSVSAVPGEVWGLWPAESNHPDPECHNVCSMEERLRLKAAGLL